MYLPFFGLNGAGTKKYIVTNNLSRSLEGENKEICGTCVGRISPAFIPGEEGVEG